MADHIYCITHSHLLKWAKKPRIAFQHFKFSIVGLSNYFVCSYSSFIYFCCQKWHVNLPLSVSLSENSYLSDKFEY